MVSRQIRYQLDNLYPTDYLGAQLMWLETVYIAEACGFLIKKA